MYSSVCLSRHAITVNISAHGGKKPKTLKHTDFDWVPFLKANMISCDDNMIVLSNVKTCFYLLLLSSSVETQNKKAA